MSCPLCQRKKLTEWLHEDDVCWACYCISHPNKIIIVLKEHEKFPISSKLEHLYEVAKAKWPNKKWRGPNSIPEHFHLHEE